MCVIGDIVLIDRRYNFIGYGGKVYYTFIILFFPAKIIFFMVKSFASNMAYIHC